MCNLLIYNGFVSSSSDKIKIGLALGDERGGDAIGLIYDNVKYGSEHIAVDNKYLNPYDKGVNFIRTLNINKSKTNHLVFGHNRKSSSGVGTYSSHPFCYPNEENPEFIFMHNGTISNKHELIKKYKPQKCDYSSIDSYIVGRIIYENGIDVCKDLFKEYEGGAVFAFSWLDKPNEMFLWKGGYNSLQSKLMEERPLYYHRTKKGVYMTSLEDQLYGLFNCNIEPVQLPVNCVYKITGNEHEVMFGVDRIGALKAKADAKAAAARHNHQSNYNRRQSQAAIDNAYSIDSFSFPDNDAFKTSNPQNIAAGNVYWYKGLYYANGHLLFGSNILNKHTGEVIEFSPKGEFKTKFNDAIHIEMHCYRGVWLKDRNTFVEANNQTLHTSSIGLDKYHEEHYGLSSYNNFIRTRKPISDFITPFLSYYTYKLNDQKEIIDELLLTDEDSYIVDKWNEYNHTAYTNKFQVITEWDQLYPSQEFQDIFFIQGHAIVELEFLDALKKIEGDIEEHVIQNWNEKEFDKLAVKVEKIMKLVIKDKLTPKAKVKYNYIDGIFTTKTI